MRCKQPVFYLLMCTLFLCLGMTGCKPSFPYYTTEGSMESREVHVHVSEGKVIEVPCGLGMGGGITAEDKMKAGESGEITKEKDGVKVILTLKSGGAVITVKEVTYNGQTVTAYEEVL